MCAIEEVKKSFENKHKKRNSENVVVDMKLMIEAHEKLSKGISIDPKVVSSPLLSSVINIINQHDLVNLEAKVKSTEMSNMTSQKRIESIESWLLKQDDKIRVLEEKVLSLLHKYAVVREGSFENSGIGTDLLINTYLPMLNKALFPKFLARRMFFFS